MYSSNFILGHENAPLTITMYSDFQCQACRWWYPRIKEVINSHPNHVKLVLKHYILSSHIKSFMAAKAALAADVQGKFYEMADVLFKESEKLDENNLLEYAKQAGLNIDQFVRDYTQKDVEWEKRISIDKQMGEESDVNGTPSFYLNGHRVHPTDVTSWNKLINDCLVGKSPQ